MIAEATKGRKRKEINYAKYDVFGILGDESPPPESKRKNRKTYNSDSDLSNIDELDGYDSDSYIRQPTPEPLFPHQPHKHIVLPVDRFDVENLYETFFVSTFIYKYLGSTSSLIPKNIVQQDLEEELKSSDQTDIISRYVIASLKNVNFIYQRQKPNPTNWQFILSKYIDQRIRRNDFILDLNPLLVEQSDKSQNDEDITESQSNSRAESISKDDNGDFLENDTNSNLTESQPELPNIKKKSSLYYKFVKQPEVERIDFNTLTPGMKVILLKELAEWQLANCDAIKTMTALKSTKGYDGEFLGLDRDGSLIYHYGDNARLYREERETLNWSVVSNNIDEFEAYVKTLEPKKFPVERGLKKTLVPLAPMLRKIIADQAKLAEEIRLEEEREKLAEEKRIERELERELMTQQLLIEGPRRSVRERKPVLIDKSLYDVDDNDSRDKGWGRFDGEKKVARVSVRSSSRINPNAANVGFEEFKVDELKDEVAGLEGNDGGDFPMDDSEISSVGGYSIDRDENNSIDENKDDGIDAVVAKQDVKPSKPNPTPIKSGLIEEDNIYEEDEENVEYHVDVIEADENFTIEEEIEDEFDDEVLLEGDFEEKIIVTPIKSGNFVADIAEEQTPLQIQSVKEKKIKKSSKEKKEKVPKEKKEKVPKEKKEKIPKEKKSLEENREKKPRKPYTKKIKEPKTETTNSTTVAPIDPELNGFISKAYTQLNFKPIAMRPPPPPPSTVITTPTINIATPTTVVHPTTNDNQNVNAAILSLCEVGAGLAKNV